MTHPLDGVFLKLNRAEKHAYDLYCAIERFVNGHFYDTVADPRSKELVYARLKNVKEPPPDLSILIGECIYQYRSALDHLALALAGVHTCPLPDDFAQTSAFPIFKTGPRFKRRGNRGAFHKMRGMSRSTRASVERLQPYHSRKHPELKALWMLEELSNIDKHRLLHVTATLPARARFHIQGTGFARLEKLVVIPRPIKEDAIVARFHGYFEPKREVDVKAELVADIAFDERSPARSVQGLSVIETLDKIGRVIAFAVMPELVRHFPGDWTITLKES